MNPFKAYDIRGVYNRDITPELAYRIGRVAPGVFHAASVLVGRDPRVSSPALRDALCRGITDSGADVVDLGICTTPTTYYFTGENGFDCGIMITASHNPKEHNGLKFSKTGALPAGYESGLSEVEAATKKPLPPPAAKPGSVRTFDYLETLLAYYRSKLPDLSGLRFAVDTSNGSSGLLARRLFGDRAVYLNEPLDGTFPNHSPNPLEPAASRQLSEAVVSGGLDGGVIFDGDADRCMFVDERGAFIRPDLVTAVLARTMLARYPASNILCDIRTSRSTTEEISRLGGVPHLWKVGHAFAKLRLRELDAPVGGELAGHYYYREFHHCDSAVLTAMTVLGVVAEAKRAGKTFASIIASFDRYANTGECNYTVPDKAGALRAVHDWAAARAPDTVFDFDGYRFEWADRWFNIRPSNTEPYLRLIAEARDADSLAALKAELEEVLSPFIEKQEETAK